MHEEIMTEVSRRKKQAGILPEPDTDAYMEVHTMHLFETLFVYVSIVFFVPMV